MKAVRIQPRCSMFGGHYVLASYNKIVKEFGEPFWKKTEEHPGDGKVNFRWTLMTNNGEIITLYDWKEKAFSPNENIWWHVGVTGTTNHAKLEKELKEIFLCVKNED